jgi:acyl carrier protein
MDQLRSELCQILEISDLPLDSPFTSMSEWDSLNALSIISMLDSYGIQMSAEQVEKFSTIREFLDYVIKNKK